MLDLGFKDGDSLLHPAGIGHGGDREIYKLFVVKAVVKFILESRLDAVKAMDTAKYERLLAMAEEERRSRVSGYVAAMYAMGFDAEYDHEEDVRFNVEKAVMKAVDAVLDCKVTLDGKGHWHSLGMPLGIGYLLVECKESPWIPAPQYESTFCTMQQVSYGLGVADLITETNAYLKTLERKHIRSLL